MTEMAPILVVEDDAALREALTDTLEISGYSCLTARHAEEALQHLENNQVGLVLSDVQMPGMDGHALLRTLKSRRPDLPVVLMTAYGQIPRAVEAIRDGAADYLPKPFEPDSLLAVITQHYKGGLADNTALVAEDSTTQSLLKLSRRVAASDSTVLLTGPSGVGKEVFARFIHAHSMRRSGPFVAVNCAAIPENLLESVLFGHEKGAFTGATSSQSGKFEQANGGTLLLDEVTELPLNLQAKLLRVLQEHEVERVGSRTTIQLNVRILAASNRDIVIWVNEGRFREDLYYRINVFPLQIPTLRERPADIIPLAKQFLSRFEETVNRHGFSFSAGALLTLTHHGWPGNIRELGNVVQRAMILAPGKIIEIEHLMLPFTDSGQGCTGQIGLKDIEREAIINTLSKMDGSRRRTAEALSMSERTLRHKLKQYREAGYLDGDDLL